MNSWLAPITAGFVAVLVGFTSSVALVFQAAQAAGASPDQIGSWIGALSLGMGACTLGLSLWYRQPVMVAWSTPGAALLITSLAGVSLPQAIGAFVFCGLLIVLVGVSGVFSRFMDKIPSALASAMLAGVLARFALDAVLGAKTQGLLVVGMFAVYLFAKRFSSRYAVLAVLIFGVGYCVAMGLIKPGTLTWALTKPNWVTPVFDIGVLISVAVPLFIVTMASQNVPGVVTMRANGYNTPVSPIITVTGLATMILAPFGAYALNLAAITAAICMGPSAHENPNKRYLASAACGVIYLIVALLAGTVATFFAAFPKEFVLGIAGIALLATIGGGLAAATKDDSQREAALVTFLVTLSGISIGGVGAAFWGLVAGLIAWFARVKP